MKYLAFHHSPCCNVRHAYQLMPVKFLQCHWYIDDVCGSAMLEMDWYRSRLVGGYLKSRSWVKNVCPPSCRQNETISSLPKVYDMTCDNVYAVRRTPPPSPNSIPSPRYPHPHIFEMKGDWIKKKF